MRGGTTWLASDARVGRSVEALTHHEFLLTCAWLSRDRLYGCRNGFISECARCPCTCVCAALGNTVEWASGDGVGADHGVYRVKDESKHGRTAMGMAHAHAMILSSWMFDNHSLVCEVCTLGVFLCVCTLAVHMHVRRTCKSKSKCMSMFTYLLVECLWMC